MKERGVVGAFHLAPQKGGYEPQRTFDWRLEFTMDGKEVIALAVESTSLPQESNEPIELPYGNESHWVAGRAKFQFGSFVVRDFIQEDVNKIISEWRKKVYEAQNGEIHFATNYKTNGHIVMMDPEGGSERQWMIEGLWPQQVNYGALAYGQNDVVKIEVVFAYDRAYRD